jgi:hypothetical protein
MATIDLEWTGVVVTLTEVDTKELETAEDVLSTAASVIGGVPVPGVGPAVKLIAAVVGGYLQLNKKILSTIDQGAGVKLTLPWPAIYFEQWWLIIPTPVPPLVPPPPLPIILPPSKQVICSDFAGHVHELSVTTQSPWRHDDLTMATAAPAAVAGSALSGYAWETDTYRSKQVVFLDSAGHVHELYLTPQTPWQHADLTAMTGAPAAAAGSALCGYAWVTDSYVSKQVVFLDSAGHVHELHVTTSSPWQHADLTAMTDAPAAAAGSPLSGYAYAWIAGVPFFAGNYSKQVVYLDPAGHVHELHVTTSIPWQHADLTALTGAPAAVTGSPLSGYAWETPNYKSKQVVFLDALGHVHELCVTPETPQAQWQHGDLTALTGAPAAVVGSPLSGYAWETANYNSKQVVFLDSAGHVHELYVTTQSPWQYADLTAVTGAPGAVTGSPLNGYAWVTDSYDSKQVVFLDSVGHVHELHVTTHSPWQHADLSAITAAPAALSRSPLRGYTWRPAL